MLHFLKIYFVLAALGGFITVGFQAMGKASGGDKVKKSLKLVKQGNLPEALKLLQTTRSKLQDDFGIDYVFSLYFLSPYQKTLKLDSSYAFCLSAIAKFEKEDAEGKKRYLKLEIDSAELYSRKDYLDSLGFSQAQRLESEAAYQYFLERFPQSRLAETAKQKRASLAFQRAKSENSFDAFMAFLDKYPDAEQARSAKEISDLLVFENTAKKGKLSDWQTFIERNPNNPYVLKAQNRLYEVATSSHTPEAYFQFITDFPDNPNTSRAWEWIFYLDQAPKNLYQLSQKYPGLPLVSFESKLEARGNRLIAYMERGKYGLMLGQGQTFIKPIFDSISEDYKCETVWCGFVKTFRKHRAVIFSLDSVPISDGEYDNAELFADGILKVFKGGRQGLISMAGYQILGPRYENIARLNQNLLSIQQGSKFYLFTTKGQKIDVPAMDEVIPAGRYFALRQGEKYALVAESEILQNLQNQPVDLQFKYSKVTRIGEDRLILYQGNEVFYFAKNKLLVLQAKPTDVYTDSPWGLQIQKPDGVLIVDTLGNAFSRTYESLRINGQVAIAKLNNRFGLVTRAGNPLVELTYDTISLLLRNSFLAKKGSKKFLIFENGKRVYFSGNKAPEVLRFITTRSIQASYFILLTDSADRKSVYNKQGRQLIPYQFDQVGLLDQHLFYMVANKKVGVADTNGRILIKPILSGASPLNKEYICVARGRSFSIVNPYTQRQIPATLTSLAKPYGQSKWFFIVRIKDKAGLMDGSGKLIIPCVYEEIMYWNPTRCLVKKNGFWYFYMVESGKELVKAMKSVRILLQRDNETIYEVESDKKVGVESTLRGEIAPTDNDEIVPFEAGPNVYFFAGRRVQSSSVYNLSYIDQNGELIKTQLLTEDEYDRIVCD